MKLYPLPSGFDENELRSAFREHLNLTDEAEIERSVSTIKIALGQGESLFLVAPEKEVERLEKFRSQLLCTLDAYNNLSLPSIHTIFLALKDGSDDSDFHRDGLYSTLTKIVEAVEKPIEMAKGNASALRPFKGSRGTAPNWQSIALAHACSQIWLNYKGEQKTSITMAEHLKDRDNPDSDKIKIPNAAFGRFVEAVWHASAIGTDYFSTFKHQYTKRFHDLKPITRHQDR